MAKVYTSLVGKTGVFFEFEPILGPEGYVRITMFRDFVESAEDVTIDGIPRNPSNTPDTIPPYEYTIKRTVLTKLPVVKKSAERYFTEATIDGFTLGIYDSGSQSDVLAINGGNIRLLPTTTDRLFTKYMKPTEDAQLYCLIEFKASGDSEFQFMRLGVLSNAISGDDQILFHESQSIYLNETTNQEYDVERFFSLKFVNAVANGLSLVPTLPTQNPAGLDKDGNETYYMPFWYNSSTSFPPTDYESKLPWQTALADNYNPATPALTKPYYVSNVYYTPDPTFDPAGGLKRHFVWPRHINVYRWLYEIFDYAYGHGNWIFNCDDCPFEFEIGELSHNFRSFSTTGIWKRPNFADTSSTDTMVLLPQAMFGLHDGFRAPTLEHHWGKRFKSAWDEVVDLCYAYGYLPTVDIDPSYTPYRAIISFRKRGPMSNRFTTIVPHESEPLLFEESESGIEVDRLKTFQCADMSQGFFDDWFACHIDTTRADTALRPQRNGYIVPQTAQKPAVLEQSFVFGNNAGYEFTNSGGIKTIDVGWYSTYPMDGNGHTHFYISTNQSPTRPYIASIDTTSDFPTVSPLMSSGTQNASGGGSDTPIGEMWAPIIRGRYESDPGNGGTIIIAQSDSWRQLLARYYSEFFVKSDRKYRRKYGTINQFACSTVGDPNYGKESWQYLDLFFVTPLPRTGPGTTATEDYYVKTFTFDFNEWTTEVEYLRAASTGLATWNDGDEVTGSVIGVVTDNADPKGPVR